MILPYYNQAYHKLISINIPTDFIRMMIFFKIKDNLVISISSLQQSNKKRRQKFESTYSKSSVEENQLTPTWQNPKEVV